MNKCLCVTMIAQYIVAKQAGHRQHPNQVNSAVLSLFLNLASLLVFLSSLFFSLSFPLTASSLLLHMAYESRPFDPSDYSYVIGIGKQLTR